ncbi:hypothetical protein [Streptomyces xinghaiensis]|uniref:hypothetical protein n=1 Tax=Streptomyces xinghaiensis TaxID=1038928 RepID=UPI000BAFA396|nr:hypothetical protein [Streptomyces xinghaiensis]
MSGTSRARVGRVYTSARRHPWVLGKLGDFTLPLGPYTPAQITVAFTGAIVLVKTFAWWSWLGPVPVIALGVAVWAVRGARIGGRAPIAAALGWLGLCLQPAAGRIGGRAARDRAPRLLVGDFTLGAPAPAPAVARVSGGPVEAAGAAQGGHGRRRRGPSRARRATAAAPAVPRSALQRLVDTPDAKRS